MLFSTPLLLRELNNGCSMQGTALQTPRIRGDRLKETCWPASRSVDNGAGEAARAQMPDAGAAWGTPAWKWQRSGQGHLRAEVAHIPHPYPEISCGTKTVVVSRVRSQSSVRSFDRRAGGTHSAPSSPPWCCREYTSFLSAPCQQTRGCFQQQ